MTPEQLGAIAGVILSLALAYIPWLKRQYDPLPAEKKAAIMGGLLVLSALGIFGLGCLNVIVLVACTVQGALDLLAVLIAALMANQASFLLLVKPFRAQG